MNGIPTDGSYVDNIEEEGDAPYNLRPVCRHFKNTFHVGASHCDKCLIEDLKKQIDSANALIDGLQKKYDPKERDQGEPVNGR